MTKPTDCRLLALDPSTSCIGWALFVGEELDTFDSYQPQGKTFDRLIANACDWLDNLGWRLMPKIIAFELPIVARNIKTTITLAQLAGALRFIAFSEITNYVGTVVEVYPGSRLAALGLPIRLKRAEAKRRVVALVNARFGLNLTQKQHDIADAIAVGLAAMRQMREATP